jgi:hypothetical protein
VVVGLDPIPAFNSFKKRRPVKTLQIRNEKPKENEALHGLKPVVSALRRTPVTLGRFFN